MSGIPTTGALFITNPRRKNGMARTRRNGLALRQNTSRAYFTLKTLGMPKDKRGRDKFKKLSAADKAKLFKKAGGQKALNAYRATLSDRKAGAKSWYSAHQAAGGWAKKPKSKAKKKVPAKKAPAKKAPAKKGKRKSSDFNKFASTQKGRGYSMSKIADLYRKQKAAKSNPRRRRNPRSYGAIALRTNQGNTGIAPIDMLSRAVDQVPVVGSTVSPYIAPLALGAAVGAAEFYLIKAVSDYWDAPDWMEPFTYSLGGVVGGTAVAMQKFVGTAKTRRMVAAGLVTAGAVIDAYRYFMGRDDAPAADMGAYEYTGGALNGLELVENPSYGAYEYTGGALNGYGAEMMGEYSDAVPADAYYSGTDFGEDEGKALMRGPGMWIRMFGRPARRMRAGVGKFSRHAGKRGHRWAWLIKLVGFEGAKQIAALDPRQRTMVIGRLRAQAIKSLPDMVESLSTTTTALEESSDLSGLGAMGAMGASGAGGFGALMYTGNPI